MKIVTVYFERKKQYRKFLTVFRRSARAIMPKVKIEIVTPEMPKNIDHKRDTAFAFLAAANYALRSKVPLVIADVDLMFVKPINDVWKIPFDIAVTTRNEMKYNTGLWLYRPSEKSRLFVKQWIKNTKHLMRNFCKYEDFTWQHGGIDQASLYMTIKGNKAIKIKELPCLEWNACQGEWKHADDKTRVIHIKSKLRLAALGKIDIPEGHEYMIPLVKKWRKYLK